MYNLQIVVIQLKPLIKWVHMNDTFDIVKSWNGPLVLNLSRNNGLTIVDRLHCENCLLYVHVYVGISKHPNSILVVNSLGNNQPYGYPQEWNNKNNHNVVQLSISWDQLFLSQIFLQNSYVTSIYSRQAHGVITCPHAHIIQSENEGEIHINIVKNIG